MYCEFCGSKIDDDANFCIGCGNRMIPPSVAYTTQYVRAKEATKTKTIIKRIIITLFVLAIIISSAGMGLNFYLKLNGHIVYDCTYSNVKNLSEKICKNIRGGDAEVEDIDSFSTNDYRVEFTVSLSGKQEETVEVDFYNYEDSDKIGKIVIEMYTSSYDYSERNAYNSCIAVASAIEKTFVAWRYVDDYADYYETMQEINKLGWLSDGVILHNYVISDGPEAIISVDSSRWYYILNMMN
ncbi:MAG: zinc ribbon domain-containing protein [Eubacterium sp.]